MTSTERFEAAAKANPGNRAAPTIDAGTYPEAVFFYWLHAWTVEWYDQHEGAAPALACECAEDSEWESPHEKTRH
jgi:hypothetical protein